MSDTIKVNTGLRIVSVPVAAGAYPKRLQAKQHLWHAAELDASNNLKRVLCRAVKFESLLDDATQFNLKPVSCKSCIAYIMQLGNRRRF